MRSKSVIRSGGSQKEKHKKRSTLTGLLRFCTSTVHIFFNNISKNPRSLSRASKDLDRSLSWTMIELVWGRTMVMHIHAYTQRKTARGLEFHFRHILESPPAFTHMFVLLYPAPLLMWTQLYRRSQDLVISVSATVDRCNKKCVCACVYRDVYT